MKSLHAKTLMPICFTLYALSGDNTPDVLPGQYAFTPLDSHPLGRLLTQRKCVPSVPVSYLLQGHLSEQGLRLILYEERCPAPAGFLISSSLRRSAPNFLDACPPEQVS